jgi:hypothetical protein
LARESRPLTPLGLAHELEQLRIAASIEHIFDCRRSNPQAPPTTVNLCIDCGLGITWARPGRRGPTGSAGYTQ